MSHHHERDHLDADVGLLRGGQQCLELDAHDLGTTDRTAQRRLVDDHPQLRRVRPVDGFISPQLGIRFDLSGPEMIVRRPDGRPFLTFEEVEAARDDAEQRAARLAELGRKARRGQASPEELQELDRLEEQSAPSSP